MVTKNHLQNIFKLKGKWFACYQLIFQAQDRYESATDFFIFIWLLATKKKSAIQKKGLDFQKPNLLLNDLICCRTWVQREKFF